jgi:hypothetical protein
MASKIWLGLTRRGDHRGAELQGLPRDQMVRATESVPWARGSVSSAKTLLMPAPLFWFRVDRCTSKLVLDSLINSTP